jgi:hypothetical protein
MTSFARCFRLQISGTRFSIRAAAMPIMALLLALLYPSRGEAQSCTPKTYDKKNCSMCCLWDGTAYSCCHESQPFFCGTEQESGPATCTQADVVCPVVTGRGSSS